MRIGPQPVDLVQRAPLGQRQPLLGASVAGPARLPGERRRELRVSRSVTQELAQVGSPLGVETEEPGAVGGEPAAVARPAERRRDGRDDAERRPVVELEPLGGRRGARGPPPPVERLDPAGSAPPRPRGLPPRPHPIPPPPPRPPPP